MRTMFLVIPLIIYSGHVFSQNIELTIQEKDNVKDLLKSISADSAFTLCMHSIIRLSFQNNLDEGEKKSLMIFIEIMNQLEKDNTKNAEHYSWKALAYNLLEDYEKVILLQSTAIRLEPGNGKLYYSRGETKYKMKNYYGASADYSKAVSFYPNDAEIYTKRAWCYIMTDQWNMAKSDAEKAILLDKTKGENYLIRGLVQIQFERKKEGCLDLDKAGDLGEPRAFQAMKEFCMPE